MKLTESATADEYRSDLLESKKYLRENPKGARILRVLNSIYGQVRSVYVLAHTPEQGEDILRMLVDGVTIVGFDLPHESNNAINVTITPIKEYERMLGRSRQGRLLLSIALALAKEDMENITN